MLHLGPHPWDDPSPIRPSASDRRTSRDRRGRPTPAFSRYALRGRRRGARREQEALGLYVDRISPAVGWPLFLIFAFQCLDTFLTLAHLLRGGKELNPLMASLIDRTPHLFVAVKLGISMVGLVFLGVHQNFPFVRKGIAVIFVIFSGIVVYHFLLLAATAT